MQAIRVYRPGGPDVLQVETVDTPQPGAGEVVIKVAAAGVNFAAVGLRRGMVAGPHPVTLPWAALGPAWITTTKHEGGSSNEGVFIVKNIAAHAPKLGLLPRIHLSLMKRGMRVGRGV